MRYAASLLYGCAVAALTAIALGWVNAGLTLDSAIVSLCAGILALLMGCLHARRTTPESSRPRGWEWIPIVLFALFAGRAFLWLIFREGDELCVLSPNNLGDMSLHLTYIEYFANGAPFWPDNPIFAQGKLAYAAGVDIFNSLLLLAGLDTIRGLLWVGLSGAILTALALWQWGRGFALMGFLCIGGLLGWAAFAQTPGEPFFQDYPGLLKYDWAWKSPPLALLVTQRGFLFALPAGLFLLSSWRARYLRGGSEWRLPIIGELLLYASMPVFHLHTFLALSFVLACWFLCRRTPRLRLFGFIAAAFVPATILVYLTIGMFQSAPAPELSDMSQFDQPAAQSSSRILGWQPGWMVNDPLEKFDPWKQFAAEHPETAPWEGHGRFLFFWIGNFGLLTLLMPWAAWHLLRRTTKRPISPLWPWLGTLAFVFITPWLGQFPRYQLETLHAWILGSSAWDTFACVAFAGTAVFCLVGWILTRNAKRLAPGLRASLLAIASVLLLHAVLETIHARYPNVPVLRANALPLLVATIALVPLLTSMARRWQPDFTSAASFFPGLYLFFLCCNVKFAPHEWDNTKLMIWACLLVLPALWELMKAHWAVPIRAIVVFLLFFPGAIVLLGGLGSSYSGYSIAKLSELDGLRKATRDLPITESFAAEPTYNHPLLLIGRKLALGYPAHLWSHGIAYEEQQAHLDSLMQGEADWRVHAARLGVRYLFFGHRESARWPDSRQAWRDGAQILAQEADWTLFDLQSPPLPITE